MQYTKHFVVGVCAAVVLALSAVPMAAQAQTYDQTREQLINEIYRLLAQLALMQSPQQGYYIETPQYRYNYQYQTPRVLGESTSNARVEVETLRAIDVEDDEASVYGNVDLDSARFADVWFEYGQDDDDLDERSRMGRIDRNDRRSFRADLEDLDEDERYYYRAVARDPQGRLDYGAIRNFFTDEDGRDRDRDDDEPDVETGRAFNIDEDSAEFDGEVDMNDFRNGRVFFAYGEDEDQIADIARDYDEYRDIDEDGDDFQVALVDSDLDDDAEYEARVFGLDDDTEHFFTICVEYEDEDDDETIVCGDVEDFETDRD